MNIDELDTPCLLIDLDIVEKNLKDMQQKADKHKVQLRPHIKTHKTLELAKMQMDMGACGITVAKVSEAEVMSEGGIKDIFIANQIVTEKKIQKLFNLSRKIKVSIGIDSLEGAELLSHFFIKNESSIDYLIEIDSGLKRCGIPKEDALPFLKKIEHLPGIKFKGVFTHAGHVYGKNALPEIISQEESNVMAEISKNLKNSGYSVDVVSIGSTPTMKKWEGSQEITEIRAGNYIFNDVVQIKMGVAEEVDCALTVLSTVISSKDERAVIDAGSKTLALDKGVHANEEITSFGKIIGKNTEIKRLSEEHGILGTAPNEKFKIGDLIQIIPNHACPVINLFDIAYGIRQGKVVSEFSIAGRGKVH